MTINRVYCGSVVQRPDLRRLHQLLDHRRRVSGRRARRTSTSSTPASARRRRRRRRRPVGRRHHRRVLLRPEGDDAARRRRWSRSTTPEPDDVANLARRRGVRAGRLDDGRRPRSTRLLRPAPSGGCRRRRATSGCDVGRQPGADRRPPAPARHRGRDPRHGLELPDRQRRHHLLHLHVLQHHDHQPGRLRRRSGPAMRADPASHKARSSRPSNNATFGVDAARPAATPSTTCSRRSRPTWTWPTAGANYSTVNMPFALGYTYEHTFAGDESAGPSTRRSSARRSSAAPASRA